MQTILSRLYALADSEYREFQAGLIPNVPKERFVGVRTPQLRALAKEMVRDGSAYDFLQTELPHSMFEEMQLHAFIICNMKDYEGVLKEVERLLPYVDNWATCDQLSPMVFKQNREKLIASIRPWMQSAHEYTVRFGMGMLMQHYLDTPWFRVEFLEETAQIRREEYYVRMMQAWFFATALAKQYDAALPFIRLRRLEPWTHRKAIQKACESRRLTQEQKAVLKTYR